LKCVKNLLQGHNLLCLLVHCLEDNSICPLPELLGDVILPQDVLVDLFDHDRMLAAPSM